MTNKSKKILTFLIVFVCALFTGLGSGKTLECNYNIDFGDRFKNTVEGSSDEIVRKTLLNYASVTSNGAYYSDNKFLNWLASTGHSIEDYFNLYGYPKNVNLDVSIDNNTFTINNAKLYLQTDTAEKSESDFTEDLNNEKFKQCPNSLVIYITCPSRTAGCKSGFITSSDSYYTDVSTFTIDSNIFWLMELPWNVSEVPAVRIRLAKELSRDEKTQNATNQCNGKVYDNTTIDFDEIRTIIKKIPSDLISKLFNVEDIEKLSDGEVQRLLSYLNMSEYFKDCSDIDSIVKIMNEDAKKLSNFQSALKKCVKDNYSEAIIDDINIDGITLSDMSKLSFLLESGRAGNKEQVKITCEMAELESMKSAIASSCAKWRENGYNSYEECFNGASKDLIQNFSCEDIANYAVDASNTFDGEENWYLTFIEQNIDAYNSKECFNKTGIEKKECIKAACEKDKNSENADERIEQISEHVDEVTEEYTYSTLKIYDDVVNISGIKTDTKICDFLGKDGIGDYINGAMNITMIAGILLTIILSITDGIKTFASFKDDESRKFFEHLKIRLICIALLIIIPTVVKFLVNLVGKSCS